MKKYLYTVVLDLTQVYDERGYTLVHMACMNSDHHTLRVLLSMADRYWQILNNISQQQQQTLIRTWINSPSLPPSRLQTQKTNHLSLDYRKEKAKGRPSGEVVQGGSFA